jgi:hypothetical protein
VVVVGATVVVVVGASVVVVVTGASVVVVAGASVVVVVGASVVVVGGASVVVVEVDVVVVDVEVGAVASVVGVAAPVLVVVLDPSGRAGSDVDVVLARSGSDTSGMVTSGTVTSGNVAVDNDWPASSIPWRISSRCSSPQLATEATSTNAVASSAAACTRGERVMGRNLTPAVSLRRSPTEPAPEPGREVDLRPSGPGHPRERQGP